MLWKIPGLIFTVIFMHLCAPCPVRRTVLKYLNFFMIHIHCTIFNRILLFNVSILLIFYTCNTCIYISNVCVGNNGYYYISTFCKRFFGAISISIHRWICVCVYVVGYQEEPCRGQLFGLRHSIAWEKWHQIIYINEENCMYKLDIPRIVPSWYKI